MENRMRLFHRVEDMRLLLLLIMIQGMNSEETCSGNGTLTMLNNTEMELIISHTSLNITVRDTVGNLFCNMNSYSCYIECSFYNFFNSTNFTTPENFTICVNMEDAFRIDFHIKHVTILSYCIVVPCLLQNITNLMEWKQSQMNVPKDLTNILNVKRMCKVVFDESEIVDYYMTVERKAINNIINMNISEQSKTYSFEDLTMTVVKLKLSKDDSLPITVVIDDSVVIQTSIPGEPFQNESQNNVGVIIYDSDEIFMFKLSNGSLMSKVIRIEVPGRDIVNLVRPVIMHFPVNYSTINSTNYHSCQFYDEKGDKTWKKDGCDTNPIKDYVVECSCNHMTPFAVLLVELNIDQLHWDILSIISYIGCGLSALFSACSILSYIVNSNARKEVSSSIHVSLSGALLLLNISFMLSEWAATLTMNGVCVFIAVAIHYSLLCCFTWMAIEALHLYILLIKVFNIYIKYYMLKMSLIGWGIPALIVGGLLTVYDSHPFYGSKAMTLSDTNTTNAVCWIKEPLILYGVNLSYFTLVFLLNFGILITISKQIFMLRKVDIKHERIQTCKDVTTVLGLMCLLGTTWGLAFFTSGYTNYPILYLFCILNTMQGFYIFMWMCVTVRKNQQQATHSRTKSTMDS
ncbi:adhesion G-protein coupled receptor G2-like isoform X2 [Myxocyprinus asiaticus]|uniref:adhesion G-protein coupled receptor G2-like isoform X2 n=1 Tax=Myxocyprinus asiaticus TaxID=70543 RepID=UPI0022231F53|nr:adhesion G-protein coupled receptor G2-like isoform X2 [Myxocyprinus asiaticus]